MAGAIGVFNCKLDDKGRVLLPSQLKAKLQPVLSEGFVLKQSVYKPCLEFYPMARWSQLMLKLEQLDPFQEDTDEFIRRFMAGHREVELDKLGRFLIPKDLVSFANLEKEVIVSSMVGKIEIWNKTEYYQAIDNAGSNFGELAKRVMEKKEKE
ncbi:MAG: division/cell wall cluster transcriptional repressor MraZ [Bacteroidales bacterium]|nr:division/cell wall cluster transcriptional repressor MraZ [Bacteroidales bacterium]